MPITRYKTREVRHQGAPIIARIYKGQSQAAHTGKGIPPELPHFRVEFDRESKVINIDRANEVWRELYGDEPTVLPNVQFQVDSIEHVFSDWMEEWAKTNSGNPMPIRRCDGETVLFQRVGNVVSRQPTPCAQQCGCKAVGRLTFWLPEFSNALGIVGQFMLITHGLDDLDRIRSTLHMVHGALGGLRNVAFTLYRKPTRKTSPEGLPVVKNDVFLELMELGAQRMALAAGDAALGLGAGMLALPSGTQSQAWADGDSIRRLREVVQFETIDDLLYSEMCRLAGISKNADADTWNRMFASFDEAKSTIVAKFQTELMGE